LQGVDSDPNKLKEIINHTTKSKSFSTEEINYHKDGTKKWLNLDINPVFDKDGKLTNYIAIETDITKNKKNQKALEEAKEKAERATKAKAQFLSTMSHEIRTPMNAVVGMSNLLLEENLTPTQREYLDTLKFSSDNLLNLINDIPDFSKIEAGRIEFESIQFNLHELIKGIKESNSYAANEKGISLNMTWDADLPEILIGDPTRLGQILNNLASNAVKFTESGGVTISASQDKEVESVISVRFEVKDTGVGIPQNNLNSIFESFTQSDVYVTRKYGGTGLGLTLTKQLVDLQNGEIYIQSAVKKGSTFVVKLNFSRPDTAHHKVTRTNDSGKNLKGYRILLVEDNQKNQFVAARFLQKWHCEYEIVENGEEALTIFDKVNFDLILMDIQMPVKDGYETTKEIRKNSSEKFRSIPIIALTAGNIMEVQNEAFQVGMDDFVTKSFNPDELYSKIKKQLF